MTATEPYITVKHGVRVESGPVAKRAKATAELLDDKVTAQHYQVGRPDRLGRPIELGKEMDYFDWKSRDRQWTVYRAEPDPSHASGMRYKIKSVHPTRDEAIRAAGELDASEIPGIE